VSIPEDLDSIIKMMLLKDSTETVALPVHLLNQVNQSYTFDLKNQFAKKRSHF